MGYENPVAMTMEYISNISHCHDYQIYLTPAAMTTGYIRFIHLWFPLILSVKVVYNTDKQCIATHQHILHSVNDPQNIRQILNVLGKGFMHNNNMYICIHTYTYISSVRNTCIITTTEHETLVGKNIGEFGDFSSIH